MNFVETILQMRFHHMLICLLGSNHIFADCLHYFLLLIDHVLQSPIALRNPNFGNQNPKSHFRQVGDKANTQASMNP